MSAPFPNELRYTKDHEWAKVAGSDVTVGITGFAVEQLGDITLVNLDVKVGDTVTAGKTFGTIESVKTLSDLFAPVSGKVIRINSELESKPELVNEDCYGKAWMVTIQTTDTASLSTLLDTTAYAEHVKASRPLTSGIHANAMLRRFLTAFAVLVLGACAAAHVAVSPAPRESTDGGFLGAPRESAPKEAPDAGGTMAPDFPGSAALQIERVVTSAIDKGQMPGCVVTIGRRDRVFFQQAYGHRSLVPERLPMTTDTIFDIASLTKPVATAASILWLVERGLLRLDDRVRDYLPEFGRAKNDVTLRHLLTHTAGLPADPKLEDLSRGREEALRRIFRAPLRSLPGTKFVYSDVGYILLEEVVRRVTGSDLARFSKDQLFLPLGMTETTFLPDEHMRPRIAPTEERDGRMLQGEVHDPRAHLLGGIAGHAGVFSSSGDLARFAQALLGHEPTVLSAETVRAFTAPHDVPGGIRSPGWDIWSRYSSNRPPSFSFRAFGHGGYTGTALWIDPEQDLFVLFLSNRVHPNGKGSVNATAQAIGEIAALSRDKEENAEGSPPLEDAAAPPSGVLTGVDVLARSGFRELRGAHVGLITNHTGQTRTGERDIDVLLRASGVQLVALFPEHGLDGSKDARIEDATDVTTQLPVYSLYGDRFAPTGEELRGIDTVVFDLQDAGTRFYTYASTLRRALEVAAKGNLRFVVLDRPNPIGGSVVQGPVLEVTEPNFVNHFPLPIRHGMTLGELARLFDASMHLGTRLTVVKMTGWDPNSTFAQTGLPWVNPSPNLRSPTEALLYPGVGLLEFTNVSVGRGTETPFEVIGAPWLDANKLVTLLRSQPMPGVSVDETTFTPTSSMHRGLLCHGARFVVTDASAFNPIRLGLALAVELHRIHPTEWDLDKLGRMLGQSALLRGIREGRSLEELEGIYRARLREFVAQREKYLLYPRSQTATRMAETTNGRDEERGASK